MICPILMQKYLAETLMKIKLITLAFIIVLLQSFSLTVSSRPWTDFVKDEGLRHGETDRISEIFDSKKAPFKELVRQWQSKEFQENQLNEYEKYGIDTKLTERALSQRLKMAQALIASDFKSEADISPMLDYIDNRIATMDRIAKLGYTRFKQLADKYEMQIEDKLYQCLCRAQGVMGTGLGFSPEPDKHCNNSDPCKGGNWGCASSDFPSDGKAWMSCAKQYPLKSGNNIFQAFDEHVNTSEKFDQEQLAKKLFDRTLKFKDACLPSMDAKNIEDIQNIFKSSVTKKATDISEASENMCEEAVAVSLYLNSEKRTTNSEAVAEGLWTWATFNPNKADKVDFAAKKLLAEGALKEVAGEYLPIISKLMNIADNYQLIKRVYKEHEADAQYKEAYKLFSDSKNMSSESLDEYEKNMQSKINTLKDKIDSSDSRYFEQLEFAARRLDEKIQMNQHSNNVIRYDQASIDALWREFASDQESKKKLYEDKKAQMLAQYTELSLYQSVIKDFRKPMREKGCDEFIKDRIQQCKEEAKRISRQTTIGQG